MSHFFAGPQTVLLMLLAAVNLLSFGLMGIDKHRARRRAAGAELRRIPEKTLFLAALLFGGVGATVGMFCFHHKTKHWYFRVGLPALALLQLAVLWWLWLRLGVALY